MKIINIQSALYLALILALAGSLNHMAHTFASVDGNTFMGWVQALAVDIGLLSIAYGINKRKVQKRSTKILWLGVLLFITVSAYGNFDYAIIQSSNISIFKAIILSAVLPVMVLYLADVLSDNNQYEEKESDKKDKADKKKEEVQKSIETYGQDDIKRRLEILEFLHDAQVKSVKMPSQKLIMEKWNISQATVKKDYEYLVAEDKIYKNGSRSYKVKEGT